MNDDNFIIKLFRNIRKFVRNLAIYAQSRRKTLKLVIGASGVSEKGWIATDKEHLNILDTKTWDRYFKPGSIDAMLAEHVWEHLTPSEANTAATNCYRYLRPNGYLRVAVPDGFHTVQSYVNDVKPAGSGSGAEDHKVLYNYLSLSHVFKITGFQVELLEYFDERGCFHSNAWDSEKGLIHRSVKYDERNSDGQLHYTSIIIDAFKHFEQ